MAVSVETIGSLGRKLTISVPKEEVCAALQTRFQDVQRNARIDGFRPGKVPAELIEKRFGETIRAEAFRALLEQSFSQALKEHHLKVVGTPHIHGLPAADQLGQDDLNYLAEFDVFPTIDLKDFSEIHLEKPRVEIVEADVEAILERMRDQVAVWDKVERAAELGDRLKVNFERSLIDVEGHSEPAEVQKETFITLEKEGLLPGLLEVLVGKAASDTSINIQVTYPDQWTESTIAGRRADLGITILEVTQKRFLDEAAFLERVRHETMESLSTAIRASLVKEAEHKIFEIAKEALLEKLLAQYQGLELPKLLLEEELKRVHEGQQVEEAHEHVHGEHCDHDHGDHQSDDHAHDCAEHEEEAYKRVLLGLLINEITRKRQIQLDNAKVREEIQRLAARFGGSPEVIKFLYQNQTMLAQVQSSVMVDQVVEHLLKEVRVIEKPMTLSELVA